MFLSACVSASDPAAVAKATKVNFNPHTGLQEVTGAMSPINGNILEGMFAVRGWKTSSEEHTHQVYLAVSSYGWLFLDAAHAYGQRLNFVAIDRAVSSCSQYGCIVTETVGVNLALDDVRRYAATGFTFQLSGKRGNKVVTVPATYFQGYLTQVPGGQTT